MVWSNRATDQINMLENADDTTGQHNINEETKQQKW